MRGYGQFCPVAKAAEVLTDRWTLLIVRDFLEGARHFNELERGLPGISRSVLAQRLRALQHAGILEVQRAPDGRPVAGYRLTPSGAQLQSVVRALGEWGARWTLGEPSGDELDPAILMWWIRRWVRVDLLPRHRVVVEFDLRDAAARTWWLVLDRDVSLCREHPGFEVDAIIRTDCATLYRVFSGRAPFAKAVAAGAIEIEAPYTLGRSLVRWLGVSPFADSVAEASRDDRAGYETPKHGVGRTRLVALARRRP